MDTKTFLIWAVIVIAIVVIIVLMIKNSKPKMMRHRPPLMLGRGNGRVVAPNKESFSDQYTMDVDVKAQDPLFMSSVPVNSPFIGNIPVNEAVRVRGRGHQGRGHAYAYGHVHKPVVAPSTESFSDQYTMDVDVPVENPIFMNSTPSSLSNPWIGAPQSGY